MFKIPGPIGLGRSSFRRLTTNPIGQPGRSVENPEAKNNPYRDVELAKGSTKLSGDQSKETNKEGKLKDTNDRKHSQTSVSQPGKISPHSPQKVELQTKDDADLNKDESIFRKKKKSDFIKIKRLGSGAFGEVSQYRDKKGNNYAVKRIKIERSVTEREIKILELLRELKCGDFKCIQMINYFKEGKFMYIQFPLYGPTLDKRICVTNESNMTAARSFQVEQINEILSQLFIALNFLHSHQIVHFDLKLNNVIFTHGECWYPENNPHSFYPYVKMVNTDIRLIDFGLAASRPDVKSFNSRICILNYRPPECILGAPISYPVDIWGCGLLGVAMYLGYDLFNAPYKVELLAQMECVLGQFPQTLLSTKNAVHYFSEDGSIAKPKFFLHQSIRNFHPLKTLKKNHSSETKRLFTLFKKMLKLDGDERPTSEQLLQMIEQI